MRPFEAESAAQLTATWQGVRDTLLARLDVLTRQLAAARDAAGTVRPSWLYEARRLQTLLGQVRQQLDHYGESAAQTVTASQRDAARAGAARGLAQLEAATPAQVALAFTRMPVEAVEALAGRASNGTPLGDLFDGFGQEAAAAVKRTLTSGVALGWSPARIARGVSDDLGVSLGRALTISRTETMGSYRSANLDTYRENRDVVEQWRWLCDKSVTTCGMCLAMDGSLHDLEEELDTHPNCRCTMVPVTRAWADILGDAGIDGSELPDPSAQDVPTGAEWFDEQPVSAQRAILGPGKYAAYADGALRLTDLIGEGDDPAWGPYRYEKSLKALGLSDYAA